MTTVNHRLTFQTVANINLYLRTSVSREELKLILI